MMLSDYSVVTVSPARTKLNLAKDRSRCPAFAVRLDLPVSMGPNSGLLPIPAFDGKPARIV
jgi:hypothetical protein